MRDSEESLVSGSTTQSVPDKHPTRPLTFRGGGTKFTGFAGHPGGRFYTDAMMDANTRQLNMNNLNTRLKVPLREVHFVGTGIDGTRNIGECRNSINAGSWPNPKHKPVHINPGARTKEVAKDDMVRHTDYLNDGIQAFHKQAFKLGGLVQGEKLTDMEAGAGSALPTVGGHQKIAVARGMDFLINKMGPADSWAALARQNFLQSMQTKGAQAA